MKMRWIDVLATLQKSDKSYAMATLKEMGLNQIADWVNVLPDHKWESMFLSRWPTLAKKCGLRDEETGYI
jgi:hypothetical protein